MSAGTDKSTIISWSEKYNTGIEFVDSQHKELVNLTNQLYKACLSGHETAKTVFKEAMNRMVNYVRFHFGAEEELLLRINYPSYAEHKKQHEQLIQKILDAAKNYNDGKKFVPNQFVRTLQEWVFSHIAFYDKQFSFFVDEQKSKGLLTNEMING